jgi:uncharacterized protein YndB with AHSA1/START domain
MDILHRIGIRTTDPAPVYDALTTIDGLAAWWTRETTGGSNVGDVVAFRFPPVGGFDMKITDLQPGTRVAWEVIDGPAEWIGTTIGWELHQAGEYTIVLFKQEGWREPVEFMYHCSTKWATYLLSLKSLIETGRGAPAPDDVQISDWH